MNAISAIPVGVKVPGRLKTTGQAWSTYEEVIPPGVSLETVMSLTWWRTVAPYLKPLDIVHVVAGDGSFDADIRLVAKTPTEMKFRILRESKIEDATAIRRESKAGNFKVVSSGEGTPTNSRQTSTWAVKNTVTGRVVADGLSKEEADAERKRLLGPDADDD